MSSYKSEQEFLSRISELETELKQIKKQKKYGLVWEDKPEDVVLQCDKQIPVLKEIKNRKIVTDNNSITNLLIEGDNYHALSVLNYTHKGKIDVIYIDPPYNTGNKDFIYNDDYVDKEDSFRHSKWLSFMEKRLKLAKDLLKDSGVIFISIDDNEQAQLRLLCDSVFGEQNFISKLIWKSKSGGANDSKFFAIDHEYLYCYANTSKKFKLGLDLDTNASTSYNLVDGQGRYSLERLDKQSLGYLESLDYPIIDEKGEVYYVEHKNPNKKIARWRWSKATVSERFSELVFKNGKVYTKNYEKEGSLPRSLLIHERFGRTRTGKTQLNELALEQEFTSPKPTNLIKYIIKILENDSATVLDFFAGSGTTGQAVMELNKEDGGDRQYILCTNNENNICEEVTYERIKRVIKGYKNKKGEKVEGLGGNLEYLKCEYIDKTKHTDNMKMRLMRVCTEMLCLKENTFELENEVKDGDTLIYRIYSGIRINDNGNKQKHFVGIYYDLDDSFIDDMRGDLKKHEDAYKTAYIFTLRNVADYIDDYRKWRGINIEEVPQKILEIYETIYKRSSRN